MVNQGLFVEIQQALDPVRVIGNNAIHPGQMTTVDDGEIALKLFHLANFIVEDRIAQSRILNESFGTLPDGVKEQIERRDGSNN